MPSYAAKLALVILRDAATCHICGQGSSHDDSWELEHVVAKAHGGSDDLSNIRLAHRSCNRRKGTDFVESHDSPWRSDRDPG